MEEREEEEILVQRLMSRAPAHKVLECMQHLRKREPARDTYLRMLRAVVALLDIKDQQRMSNEKWCAAIEAAMADLNRNKGYYDALSKQQLRRLLQVIH